MAPETSVASVPVVRGPAGRFETEDGLVDNPFAFGTTEDPSLQIFLSTEPDASVQSGFKNQADTSNGIRSKDWILLRLGDGACVNHEEPATAYGLNSNQQMYTSTRKGSLDTTTENASLLLGMNDSRQDKAKKQRSDNSFSFPRQKRSVRRARMFLSIDSDSE